MNELTQYTGKGNHSVHTLEKMVEERDEKIYQMKLQLQQLIDDAKIKMYEGKSK
jgi:hypothetical protein